MNTIYMYIYVDNVLLCSTWIRLRATIENLNITLL